jgi:hypothetical protein
MAFALRSGRAPRHGQSAIPPQRPFSGTAAPRCRCTPLLGDHSHGEARTREWPTRSRMHRRRNSMFESKSENGCRRLARALNAPDGANALVSASAASARCASGSQAAASAVPITDRAHPTAGRWPRFRPTRVVAGCRRPRGCRRRLGTWRLGAPAESAADEAKRGDGPTAGLRLDACGALRARIARAARRATAGLCGRRRPARRPRRGRWPAAACCRRPGCRSWLRLGTGVPAA